MEITGGRNQMKQIRLLSVTVMIIAATVAKALPPPAHGGYQEGWGMNPNNWEEQSGTFSFWGLYDPLYPPQQSAAWVVDWSNPSNVGYVSYEPIKLELWIEMYMLLTYEYTSYQWHRLGNEGETITFIIQGTTQMNSEVHVRLLPGADPLTDIKFVEDIFDRTGPAYGSDIPITWRGRWGNGLDIGQNVQWGWEVITPDPVTGALSLSQMPPCDHWFQFEGSFTLPYHIDDGYYHLVIKGCPDPTM